LGDRHGAGARGGGLVIDFTLSQLVMRACAVLVISALQGFAVAAAAVALGDEGPRQDGRLSIDPLRHVDLLGGAVALVFVAGWSRRVAIDPRQLRHGRFGLLLVILAGFAAVVLGALGLRFARPFLLPLLPDTAAATAFELVRTTIDLGIWFALLGLLPVPPLVGGHLLLAIVPKLQDRLPRAQLFLGLILAGMVATGWVTRALDPAFRLLMGFVGEDVGM
jgi:Zn-dependent protease